MVLVLIVCRSYGLPERRILLRLCGVCRCVGDDGALHVVV